MKRLPDEAAPEALIRALAEVRCDQRGIMAPRLREMYVDAYVDGMMDVGRMRLLKGGGQDEAVSGQ